MSCAWCGADAADGFRLHDPEHARGATFCRLEHLVACSIRGMRWGPPADSAPPPQGSCALCSERLSGMAPQLVRTRGEHRVADGFCTLDHLFEWARSGGRYRAAAPRRNADAPGR